MRYRGTGLLCDEHDERDYSVASLLGVYSEPPQSHSIAYLRFLGLDQGRAGACVAFAAAQAVWTRQRAMGLEQPLLLSPMALYHDGRMAEQAKMLPLSDDGLRPRSAWDVLRTVGPIAWDDWPWDDARWDMEPPWGARRAAADRDWLRYYRLDAVGNDRVSQLMQTLASDRPVCLGLTLDGTFDRHDGRRPWYRVGPSDGRHMVTAVGYDSEGVWVANSWGDSWGMNGLGWVSWRAIVSDETTDLTVPEIDLGAMP